eukprot:1139222-Amphidinium_carterae.1
MRVVIILVRQPHICSEMSQTTDDKPKKPMILFDLPNAPHNFAQRHERNLNYDLHASVCMSRICRRAKRQSFLAKETNTTTSRASWLCVATHIDYPQHCLCTWRRLQNLYGYLVGLEGRMWRLSQLRVLPIGDFLPRPLSGWNWTADEQLLWFSSLAIKAQSTTIVTPTHTRSLSGFSKDVNSEHNMKHS